MHRVDCTGYDKVWVSAIFANTIELCIFLNGSDITFGGTGISIDSQLPFNIYAMKPDYSIYPDNDTSYGFIYRGCCRDCKFCVVPEKEGYIHREVNSVHDLICHKRIKFLDNNFISGIDHKVFLKELIDCRIRCQFNQGLDIRLLDREDSELLSRLNYIGEYTFAFDNIADEKLITEKLEILKEYVSADWKIRFFIYCHPDMDIPTDVYHRICWCKENKVLPYFMRDLSCWGSRNARTYADFSAWCNQPGIFKHHTYEEFCKKRRPQTGRGDIFPEWFSTRTDINKY